MKMVEIPKKQGNILNIPTNTVKYKNLRGQFCPIIRTQNCHFFQGMMGSFQGFTVLMMSNGNRFHRWAGIPHRWVSKSVRNTMFLHRMVGDLVGRSGCICPDGIRYEGGAFQRLRPSIGRYTNIRTWTFNRHGWCREWMSIPVSIHFVFRRRRFT